MILSQTIQVRLSRVWPGLFLLAALSGCASWQKQGVQIAPPQKLRVVVLPLALDFPVKRPSDLETVTSSETVSAAEQGLQTGALKARLNDELAAAFELRVSSSYLFSPVPRAEVAQSLAELGLSTAAALSSSDYRQIAQRLRADVVLRVRVHGYGRIKTSWLLLLWGSSFVEGGAQGVAVAEAAANVWAAVGVAAEEVLQEGVEWLGGGYLFNRFYAPVIIEGDLYSGATGRRLWGRWYAVTKNKKAAKQLPKVEQRRKEVLLLLTFEKARDEMIKKLETAALKNEAVEDSRWKDGR